MKKVLIAAIALMMGASLSLAAVGIDWQNDNGYIVEYGGNTTAGPGLLENNSAIWQLIYAGVNKVADTPDLTKENYLGGDDVLWAQRTLPQADGGTSTASDGTKWSDWLEKDSGSTLFTMTDEDLAAYSERYVYQRIWQGTPDTTGEKDSYYFDTDPFQFKDTYVIGDPNFPDSFAYAAGGVAIDQVIQGTGPGPVPPTPPIPEPATMSLLGLGALAMVLRRKMSK